MSSFDGWGDDEGIDVSVTSLGDDGWGEDDDLFGDDGGDNEENVGIGFPPAAPAIAPENTTTTKTQSRSIPTAQSRHVPTPNDCNIESHNVVAELSNYIKSLDRMLSSINAVLEFEYNTCQKAEELVEYYETRPQLAEYTRTKELPRMNYEVVLPDGYVETNKERIIGENLLPDNAIISRAANQSLLADLLQVITGHDLIVRPQYMTICIATWCKFIIHRGDHGADMIDCRARLSLFLPTAEGDRLSIAEVTVSVIFSPSRPIVEFKVVKIEVLLKDFSKLIGVADFISAMEGNNEDHEVINAPPDIYRDAFLEKSQRFFTLSSEGMKSAFQQMDSVINLKGKMRRISSFIPDTDQVLAAEQEAIAFAEAKKNELQRQQQEQQHRDSAFPRPPPTQAPNPHYDQSQNTRNTNDTNRPKSILGGLVRSGWKTLANSVVIPDDDPAIYGEFVPSPPLRAPLDSNPDQQMPLYRKEEDASTVGQSLYRNDDTQNAPIPNQGQKPQMHYQRHGDSNRELQSRNIYDKNRDTETLGHNSFGLGVNRSISGSRTTTSGQSDPRRLTDMDHKVTENRIEKSIQPVTGLSRELGEPKDERVNKEEVDTNVENGWDDGFDDDFGDDLDDVSDNIEESLGQPKTSSEQDQEGIKSLATSSDHVLVDSLMLTENILSSCDTKYDEEGDICDTRRRWVNPRPNRPYLKY
jgi:hypothetical protein